MARFRNKTDQTLSVNKPSGPEAHKVAPGESLKVAGEVKESADAYTVGSGDKARAYPKALWESVEDAPKPEKVARKEDSADAGRSSAH